MTIPAAYDTSRGTVVATGIYLVDNPPRQRQFRSPRRAKPSGVCVVHTAEAFADESPPDSGAENVARFIKNRSTYGSYHDLCDSDSTIQLVRYSDEAFHDGTGSNPHSYGVSAAAQAAKWNSYSRSWREATVKRMARAAARYAKWLKRNYGITIPARRITRAQSENRVPGFISHAERDPARRTDPGRDFPWSLFLSTYAAEMSGTTTPPPEDDVRPSEWNADDRAAVRDAIHGQNKFTGNRIVNNTNKNTDWHDRIAILHLEHIREKVDVLTAAQAGEDLAAILQRVDAHHADVLAQLEADEEHETAPVEPKTHAREVLARAGFTGEALDIALGVAFAESGGFADAVGDLGIVSDKWGPSIGLFQVRSLRDPMAGNEADRYRIAFALRDPDFNAVATFAISAGGTDWSPWSVFRNGTHAEHVGKDFEIATGHERADQWNT